MAPWGYDTGTATAFDLATTTGTSYYYVNTASTTNNTWDDSTHNWRYVPYVLADPVPVRPRTPEQVRADAERDAVIAERDAVIREETARRVLQQTARDIQFRREEKRAKLQSLKLLKEVLGPQWQEYRVDKSVTVPSGGHRPGVRYRIRPDQMIDVLDQQGRVTDRLCIHTVERVPEGDDVVAKFLMATADEERLWRTANRHPAPAGVR